MYIQHTIRHFRQSSQHINATRIVNGWPVITYVYNVVRDWCIALLLFAIVDVTYETLPIKHLLPSAKVMALTSICQSKSTKLWHLLLFATSGIRK